MFARIYVNGFEKLVSASKKTYIVGDVHWANGGCPGQFAESAYAAPPLGLLLKRFISLNKPGFPLEDYYALSPQPYRTAALLHLPTPAPYLVKFFF